MRYAETVLLKGGVELLVRNAVASDARALRDIMQRTHAETDYLLSYPDEQSADDEQEARSLVETERSDNEVELVAVVDGRIVGSAGVTAVGGRRKVAHRARFGISVLTEHWGMGIGRVLMESCIDSARRAGYTPRPQTGSLEGCAHTPRTPRADTGTARVHYQPPPRARAGCSPPGAHCRCTIP